MVRKLKKSVTYEEEILISSKLDYTVLGANS